MSKTLIKLIKESVKKAREVPEGPLINYVPPGSNIIINPIVSSGAQAPAGLRPSPDTK